VVIIGPVQSLNVQGYPGIHGKRLKPFPNQFRIKGAHFAARKLRLENKEWATGDVDCDACQGLVHRYVNVAIARDAPHIAECLFECLAKRNPTIFGRVMLIDMQISLRPQLQVDARVASEEIEHVIQKADAGRNRRRSSPVEVDRNLDIRFVGLALDRRGAHGVATWIERIERWLADAVPGFAAEGEWYAGRPLLVTENDYGLRLYNGDTGVVVASAGGRVSAAFERRDEVAEFTPARLGAVETVYAMTIHKSQGSQFDTAAVLLPEPTSQILTRELLYTAVTRAREHLVLVSPEETVRRAVARPVARASGLQWRLWGTGGP